MRKQAVTRRTGREPLLEPPLREDRHLAAGDGAHAAGHDLALEGVEPFMVPVGERDEGNALRDLDDVRQRVGTEPAEAERGPRRVGAHVATALPAGIGLRMLDRVDAPALLVEHPVGEDALDREFRVVLDRIVLEVLIPPVTVHEPLPVGIPLADPAAEGERRGRRLDVEPLVILDRADGRGHVDRVA